MKFIRIIKELNTDVHARLTVRGDLTRHFWVQLVLVAHLDY